MRSKVEITTDFDRNKKVLITLSDVDMALHIPSDSEEICKETYKRSNKISDMLMWLSEIFVSLEDKASVSKGELRV